MSCISSHSRSESTARRHRCQTRYAERDVFDLEPKITLPWLVRLRWAFVVGQIVIFAVVRIGFSKPLAWWPFAIATLVPALSNLAIGRRPICDLSPAHIMGGVLLVDTALLTAQLAGVGGASNPFTVMYLVYITLSAIVLSAKWTTAVATLAIAGFALLFAAPTEMHVHHSGPLLLNPHLQGMWVAFVVAAALTAFFVRRISRAIATQREQIGALRETAARNARHASLATLAAGAAHELNTPMSTIVIAAHEAMLCARTLADGGAITADLELIVQQVERCQQILHQMAARVTAVDIERTIGADELVAQVRAQLGDRGAAVDIAVTGCASPLLLPAAPVVQSLLALIRNALDASTNDARVRVEIRCDKASATITVEDSGVGIPEDVLAKVGEPFFTTKPPGRGLGLGVFLARVFFESHGGALEIESGLGVGTRAVAHLPVGGLA